MRLRWWLLLVLAFPVPAPAASLPVPVRVTRLANGLTVLVAPDSQATTVDMALWYPAGTRYERAGRRGITHLFDGLMFGGSQGYAAGEHRRLLQTEGGSVSIFTTPDYSCFYESMPPQALDLALRLEADRMAHLTLTQRTLDAVRAATRQQREGGAESSPLGRGFQKLFATAFAGHPYAWPVSGFDADINRITLADCQAYYRDHYGPGGALLTVVGRLDTTATLAAIRRAFGAIPRRGLKQAAPALTPQADERRGTGSTDLQVPLVLAGWRTPPDNDPDMPSLDLLGRVLARGSTSRLNRELAGDAGIALIARGDFDRRAGGGLFYVLLAVPPQADTAEVERRLVSEVEKLGEEPVSAAELDVARRQAQAEVYTGWQTTRGLAQSLGNAQLLDGDWQVAARRLERLRDLTPEELRKAAARSFVAANRTLVWMHPGVTPPDAPDEPAAPGSSPRRGQPTTPGGR
jgi:zinc protease